MIPTERVNQTRQILDALRHRHDQPRDGKSRAWVYVEEVRVGTGYRMVPGDQAADPILFGWEQRIDAFALHTWPSKRFRRVAYEVKISRSDLRRELNHWTKSQAGLALSNQFYLVCPNDILTGGVTDDVPEAWGIMTFDNGRLRTLRLAPWRDTDLPPYTFMLSLARNLQHELESLK